ncbi:type II toxin-antitoxin system death-on-curing family toxin [Halorientalis pallida]|uniref:Type II toxin-antitoxin system death-on-curing family toxin n=1 Tax=Halorientalis pallida TaxID=2479928 RepID=A0A498KUH5_9EURY|nr:type II toxin-antitoxin system death-on-curing family toxin [Halorientalis pallida]RXK47014.1 type II toxin-antitoxin system death-on-curing family toxin [Halorientalis pallida]
MTDESGEDETGDTHFSPATEGSDIVSSDDLAADFDSELWYPTVEDIVEIHDDIIAEDEQSEPGIEEKDRIQYAVDYIKHGVMSKQPETIHEKAFALMRLIASNHWFVDGNKRTALNTTNLFYYLNGYELEYGEDLRAMLKLLAVREDIIDRDTATGYLADQTEPLDEDDWMTLGLTALLNLIVNALDPEDIDAEEILSETADSTDLNNHNG